MLNKKCIFAKKLRMKKIIYFAFLGYACLTMQAEDVFRTGPISRVSPEVKVEGKVSISGDGSFAVAESDGKLIKINLNDNRIETITEGNSFYNICISDDNKSVTYTETNFDDSHRRLLTMATIDIDGKNKRIIANKVRDLAPKKSGTSGRHSVTIHRGHLVLDGDILDPQGKGSYLWPSVSPDGNSIVYWLTGQGCFVYDIKTCTPRHIGGMRAAVWLDDESIIGMYDLDDGRVVTDSRLVAMDLNSGEKQLITPESMIALFPAAGAGRIIFSDAEGYLYQMEISR